MTAMTEHSTIDLLAFQLEERKAEENKARDARIKAEDALIAAIGLKEEGTTTAKTPWYKITTTGNITRKLVPTADMPDKLLALIARTKRELDVSALKRLATEDPKAYQFACQWIESKPAKPTVKVERIAQGQEAA